MLQKIRSAKFKAVTGSEPGTFSAVVAVYGNVDTVGDRIIDGAFDKSLQQWRALGDPIPIVLAHEWKNPFAHIGYAMPDKIKSVPGVGLVVEEGHLDMDNPTAAQVHRLMMRKTLKEFSFGYGIPPGGQTKASDGAMDLRMLDLIEFGPCLKGVNDKTELLSIKSRLADVEDTGNGEFVEVVLRIKADEYDAKAKRSPGRARWRTQKRDPNTGKWIDETVGAGFGGKPRKVNPNFGADKIDDRRKEANDSITLSGREKFDINKLLNEAEDSFLAGDNESGEAKVREAAIVKRESDDRARYARAGIETNRLQDARAEATRKLVGAIKPGDFGPTSDEDKATPEEEAALNSQMDEVERLMNDPEADSDHVDDLMGDLHVDNEQSEFSPETEARYQALERKWLDDEFASSPMNTEDESLGNRLAAVEGADEDESAFLALLSDSLTHNMLEGEMYNPDGWQEMMELENTPSVKKLLKDPEIAAAWKDIKKYGQDNGWADWEAPAYVPAVRTPLTEIEKDKISFLSSGGEMEIRPGVTVSRDGDTYYVTAANGSRGTSIDRRGAEYMVESFSEQPGESDQPTDPTRQGYSELGPGPGPGESMAESLVSEAFNEIDKNPKRNARASHETVSSVRDRVRSSNLSEEDKATADDLLDAAQYFITDGQQEDAQYQYDAVLAMLALARRRKNKKGRPKPLSLEDQISAMQSDSAILSAESRLERMGMKVLPDPADETLRRLTELEQELL